MREQNKIYLAGNLPGYAQGGVVADGLGYFVAGSRHLCCGKNYPNVAAFDLKTLRIVRTYDFGLLGDSTPLVVSQKNGNWIVIGHEGRRNRTVAYHRDSGRLAWISAANQPGDMFFGFSYYTRSDGAKILLVRADDGLHAVSAENGREVWHVRRQGGMTPAVDQKAGAVYYQSCGCLDKINAATGRVIKSVPVFFGQSGESAKCVSGNTLLVKDQYGCFVVTCWNNLRLCSSTIKVFDRNLKPVWQTGPRLMSKKATLCYHGGMLFTGFGDSWSVRDYQRLPDNAWKKICAFKIDCGKIGWECDLSAYPVLDIQGVIYCRGLIIAQTTWLAPYHVFVLDARTGRLIEVYDKLGRWASSCAQPLLSGGRLFNGDYNSNSILAVQIGSGQATDWPGAFGDPQLHHMAAPDDALLPEGMAPRSKKLLVGDFKNHKTGWMAGMAKYRKQKYAAAAADFKLAFDLAGRTCVPSKFLRECELMLGHAFFYAQKYADASAVYDRILAMEDAPPRIRAMAQLHLAHCLRLSGAFKQALCEYGKIATMSGFSDKWLWALAESGNSYWRAHEYDKARHAYMKVLRAVRDVPKSIKRQAAEWEREGRKKVKIIN